MAENGQAQAAVPREELPQLVSAIVGETPVFDVHTHLYSPRFGELLLWGVDELLTYHYLIAEVLRSDRSVTPEQFYAMPLAERAEHIWRTMFAQASPLSEAQRGVLTTLKALGIEPGPEALAEAREYFAHVSLEEHVQRVFQLANVSAVVMTNDPFDSSERKVWLAGGEDEARFRAALRLDGLIVNFAQNLDTLRAWGYDVSAALDERTMAEVRRFLEEWIERIAPMYLAVSLPDTFAYPSDEPTARLIAGCVLPVSRERGVPFAMMIGVKRGVNPALKLAGDGVGKFDICALERLCAENPENRFLVTLLSRENQHELCVAARKFPNLMPFGCWWFLNNPSIIEEITRERLELLGLSFIPQHSDARVLDQLIYKWAHSREIIARVLADKYSDLARSGWPVTEEAIRRDVARLFSGNFLSFVGEQD